MSTPESTVIISHLTAERTLLKGSLAVRDMPRLHAVLTHQDTIGYKLSFRQDRHGRVMIDGSLKGALTLICDYCLEPVLMPVETTLNLVVVTGEEEAKQMDPLDEPLVIEDGSVSIPALIEDELLLSIPMVVCHPPSDNGSSCAALVSKSSRRLVQDTESSDNPFLILKSLTGDSSES